MITPNVDEAAVLTGLKVTDLDEMRAAAAKLHQMGSAAVVITGGHLEKAIDLVEFHDEERNRAGSIQGGAAAFELHSRHGLRFRHGDVLPPGARARTSRSCIAGEDLRDCGDCGRPSPGTGNRAGSSSLSHAPAAARGGIGKRVVGIELRLGMGTAAKRRRSRTLTIS